MDKTRRIKAAVRRNFDDSPERYDAFEAAHGLFGELTRRLTGPLALSPGARLLEIGCGTGASTAVMLETLPGCRILGVDISAAMLARARLRLGASPRVQFVQGDALQASRLFRCGFDAVVYSASIFLLPDFHRGLERILTILPPGGWVAASFMDGIYTSDGRRALEAADRRAGTSVTLTAPVRRMDFERAFRDVVEPVRLWQVDLRVDTALLAAFYDVPAMSAGLYPRLAYPQRRRRVSRLMACLPAAPHLFRWAFAVGRRAAGA